MKRLAAFIAAIIILYAIYYDLSQGTLPTVTKEKEEAIPAASTPSLPPYFEKKVVSGDTVLSIIEEKLDHSIPVPISEVESDFKKLNKDIAPKNIQPGNVYKFPKY